MVKIREGVVRIIIGLVVAGAIGSQIPHVNGVALAASACPSISGDADNPALGLQPRDLALTALGVDAAVGIGYVLTAHHGSSSGSASNNGISSPFAQTEVQHSKALKPTITGSARTMSTATPSITATAR